MTQREIDDIRYTDARASVIARRTGAGRSEAIAKASMIMSLINEMRSGTARFTYYKVDGRKRSAVGTLKVGGKFLGKDIDGVSPNTTICYYDLQMGGFRSFKVENLISVD